jgi:hypothetical protein
MLRRRRPYKNEDVTGSTRTMTIFLAHQPEQSRPFDMISDEIIQHMLAFLPNEELPTGLDKRFTINSIDMLAVRAKKLFRCFVKDKFVLKIESVVDARKILKTVADYAHFCIASDDTALEKQAKFAVMLLMVMQVMEYLTRNKTLEFEIQRDETYQIIINGDLIPEPVIRTTAIDANDVKSFQDEIQKRFGKLFCSNGTIQANESGVKAEIQSNLDWLVKQSVLLKLSVPDTQPSIFSTLIACSIWANPVNDKLANLTMHCLQSICDQIGTFSKSDERKFERRNTL